MDFCPKCGMRLIPTKSNEGMYLRCKKCDYKELLSKQPITKKLSIQENFSMGGDTGNVLNQVVLTVESCIHIIKNYQNNNIDIVSESLQKWLRELIESYRGKLHKIYSCSNCGEELKYAHTSNYMICKKCGKKMPITRATVTYPVRYAMLSATLSEVQSYTKKNEKFLNLLLDWLKDYIKGINNLLLGRIGIEVTRAFEYYHGRIPEDRDSKRKGYDIYSKSKQDNSKRFIEVKTYTEEAPTIRLTEHEFNFLFGVDLIKNIKDQNPLLMEEIKNRWKEIWIYVVVVNEKIFNDNDKSSIILYELPISKCNIDIFTSNMDLLRGYFYEETEFSKWSPSSTSWEIIPNKEIKKIVDLSFRLKHTYKQLGSIRSIDGILNELNNILKCIESLSNSRSRNEKGLTLM